MASGTLQQSGDIPSQINQLITTLGGTNTSDGRTDQLKALNVALAAFSPGGGSLPVGPASASAESIPRAVGAQSVTIAIASGDVHMQAIYIPANTLVTSLTNVIGSTASSNDVTADWLALCDSTRKVLAVSANATAQLTPAGFLNTQAMGTPFTTLTSGLYYVAMCINVTTTQPTLCGVTAAGTELNKIVPISAGISATAGTATPPTVGSTLGAITVSASSIYCYVL